MAQLLIGLPLLAFLIYGFWHGIKTIIPDDSFGGPDPARSIVPKAPKIEQTRESRRGNGPKSPG